MTHASNKNIPYLDGWRGVAIALVLICHFGDPSREWIGELGVLIFFVLSGFLMSRLLFVTQVQLKEFFKRRFNRIVPTFWLFTLTVVIYSRWIQTIPYKASATEVLATLTFFRTYWPEAPDIWHTHWPIGHFWSLNVEEHSYVYLALGAFLCRKLDSKIVALAFLLVSASAVLLLNIYYINNPPANSFTWHIRSESASLGLLAAAALRVAREKFDFAVLKTVSPLLPVLTFAIAFACFSTYAHKGVHRTLAPLCLAFTVVYLDQVPQVIRSMLSAPALVWLGVCSFSIYLWQQPFFSATQSDAVNPILALTIALSLGTLSFYFFESPIRHRLNLKTGPSSRAA